jgi:uncharacterized protein (TIGR00369 family)
MTTETPGERAKRLAERSRGTMHDTLELTFEEITPERVIITMPVTTRVHQPFGVLHGGASVALAESAASIGANANCPDGMVAMGQEINANHLRPRVDGTLRAVAVPIHVGRTSQVWTVEIRDEAEKLVCVSRCTLAVVKASSPPS